MSDIVLFGVAIPLWVILLVALLFVIIIWKFLKFAIVLLVIIIAFFIILFALDALNVFTFIQENILSNFL
ncbi:MAG: hypothetical protein NT038_00840 [Euryarchaeota archaeon]|nr:hypothetical protein [Euryarchaeota archaeon]